MTFGWTVLRKGLTFALLLLVASASLVAQETNDEYDFDDIPVDDETVSYIGVGGGFLGMLTFMNFDELNQQVAAPFGLANMDGQMFLSGGGGVAAIGIIQNVRLGVFSAGGSKEVSAKVNLGGETYSRTLRFSTGFTGAQIDYAIPVFKGFNVFPGVMLGAGSYSLEMIQSKDGDDEYPAVFDPGIFDGATMGNRHYSKISQEHFFWYPAVNLEYALTQFFMVRAGAGYSGSTGGDWTDEAGTVIKNVPDINAQGLSVQFGLFIGLFQQ